MKASFLFAAACSALLPLSASASCGTAFCTVNANWTADSAATEEGSVLDLRIEYVHQNQPRSESRNLAVGEVRRHHDEVSTVNRNVLLTYSHTFNAQWGISVVAPVVDREHVHIHNHHGAQIPGRWNFTELGDVRLLGRYQLPTIGNPAQPSTTGIILGVKLPTGRTGVRNAENEEAERTLQPGSGTTDAILGAYYHQKLPQWNASWFTQVQAQHALRQHEGYRPGDQLGVDLGYRHSLGDRLGALLQFNALLKRRDSGAEAEPRDSGGRFLYVSPGLGYAVSDTMQVYGFFQKPVYQHVNGVQLTATKAFVIGMSGRF